MNRSFMIFSCVKEFNDFSTGSFVLFSKRYLKCFGGYITMGLGSIGKSSFCYCVRLIQSPSLLNMFVSLGAFDIVLVR